jgi:nucleotide-binding universal stress UspA family protein
MYKAIIAFLFIITATFTLGTPSVALAQSNCSNIGTNEEINAEFYNDLGFDVAVRWVTFECDEADPTVIPADTNFSFTTYDGHEFNLYDAEGNFLGYFVLDVSITDSVTNISDFITFSDVPRHVQDAAQCSLSGTGEEMTITLLNYSNTDIIGYWFNFECERQEVMFIQANGYFDLISYDGHEFIFTAEDKELLSFVALSDNAGTSLDIQHEIAQQGSATLLEESVNPSREAQGLAPLEFNTTLYSIAEQAVKAFEATAEAEGVDVSAIISGGDLTPISDSINELANQQGAGRVLSAIGVHNDGLLNPQEVDEILHIAFEDSDTDWLHASNQSFAVYASEHLYVIVFSDIVPEAEEWATFEFEPEAPAANTEATVSITTTLDSSGNGSYEFDAIGGVPYVLYLSSDEFDTTLALLNSAGEQIAFNDDGAGNLNSLIALFIPESGTYTAIVSSFNNTPMGEYSLLIGTPSSVINGGLSAGTSYSYPLEVVEGTFYYAFVDSAAFDTTLTITDTSGAEIASNDDRGDGTTNSFVFFYAASTGTYEVTVGSYNGQGAGSFTLFADGLD